MGKEKTGLPKEISSWRDTQYLDLERRRLHIPPNSITWQMLGESLRRELSTLPIGYYSGDGSTFQAAINEQGRVVFVPVIWGNSKYGLCVYGGECGIYGTACYGEITYCRVTVATGKYDGTGGYGNVVYA